MAADRWLVHHHATILPTGEVQANDPVPAWVQHAVQIRINYTQFIGPTCESFDAPPPDAAEAEIRRTVERWLEHNPARVINGRLQSLYPHTEVPQCMQSWMERTQVAALESEAETATNSANVAANPPLATTEIDAQGDTVEDPIVIDEATSNSDNDSTEGTDETTWAPKQI